MKNKTKKVQAPAIAETAVPVEVIETSKELTQVKTTKPRKRHKSKVNKAVQEVIVPTVEAKSETKVEAKQNYIARLVKAFIAWLNK